MSLDLDSPHARRVQEAWAAFSGHADHCTAPGDCKDVVEVLRWHYNIDFDSQHRRICAEARPLLEAWELACRELTAHFMQRT